jgi:hypothetical protein
MLMCGEASGWIVNLDFKISDISFHLSSKLHEGLDALVLQGHVIGTAVRRDSSVHWLDWIVKSYSRAVSDQYWHSSNSIMETI